MRFFLPLANGAEQEERVYRAVKDFIEPQVGAVESRRVFKVSYQHNGKDQYAEVGKKDAVSGELVIAIFYDKLRDLYLICTANRGVARGSPILASGRSGWAEDFESTD